MGLESLSIPDGVVKLGESGFSECNSLQSVTFGVSTHLERICAWAFSWSLYLFRTVLLNLVMAVFMLLTCPYRCQSLTPDKLPYRSGVDNTVTCYYHNGNICPH